MSSKSCFLPKRIFLAVIFVFLLSYFYFLYFFLVHNNFQENQKVISITQSTSATDRVDVKVTRVVDGDTFEIQGGKKVRYIGINTPELGDSRTPVQCFAKEAKVENIKIIEGKTVTLVRDISDKDKYGRLLRYVYVGDIFVNEKLVRDGYAQAATYPPDIKFEDVFKQAQKFASSEKLGLWSKCSK
ncbi:MAG TPA: thermonuclease family protein [Patescibacteria group bacterium]